MILVTGAAGKTGRSIVRALAAKGQAVRAAIRRAEQAPELARLGAREVAVGDLRDRAFMTTAAQGVRAMYHICPNVDPDEVAIGESAIHAAQEAAVERFAFHSVLHPQTESMPHHWRKLRVEERLFESGLRYTILQPAPYMQNVLVEWKSIAENGVYQFPYSADAPFSPVDVEDVAEAAAIMLTGADHVGAIYELAGPEIVTPKRMAETMSRVLQRPVRAESIPIEAWAEQAGRAGLSDVAIDTLGRMFAYYDRFGLWGNSRALANLLGRAPTSFEAFLHRAAAAAPSPTR